jgi:deoxyuridine 5'-triphosphate nucleotidohydrolase
VDIPHGYVGLIHPRSSIGAKGVIIPNAPGTIDSGYTGELKILLINVASNSWVTFSPGERIAQLIIQKVELPEVVEVDQIGYSIPEHRPNTCACELAHGLYGFRGSGGFGSTGK